MLRISRMRLRRLPFQTAPRRGCRCRHQKYRLWSRMPRQIIHKVNAYVVTTDITVTASWNPPVCAIFHPSPRS